MREIPKGREDKNGTRLQPLQDWRAPSQDPSVPVRSIIRFHLVLLLTLVFYNRTMNTSKSITRTLHNEDDLSSSVIRRHPVGTQKKKVIKKIIMYSPHHLGSPPSTRESARFYLRC